MRDVQQESVLATSTFEAVARWNRWRRENPETKPSLEGAHLLNAVLQEVDLSHADLRNAFLRGAHLYAADLSHADLRGAILVGANLNRANLRHANLEDATLASATLNEGTDIEGANFHRCKVYGVAAWDLQGTPLDESDLSLELKEGSTVTVDGLAMAQFMHLILRNASLTNAINALQSKVVLILGRFTPRRKAILDAVRAELASSRLGYVPVIFDFAKPAQTVLETVTLLARMSRFVIADLTSAKSVLQELQAIVPLNPSLPVQPIIFGTGKEPEMVDFFRKYPWYLPLARYRSSEDLIDKLRRSIVRQLEQAAVGARK